MKLQYLAVIFLIIIMPIVMVLSQYIDYQIDAINLKHAYNTKLLDATYDSIKAYQLNTVNNAISDISTEKIEGLEAAVNTFFNSLTTNFNYTGYNSSVMKEYVPAVVFTMYDGYYIYSPYKNVLTGVPRTQVEDGETISYVDEGYEDYSVSNEVLHGIKSYVYYSCRYNKDDIDVVITYTLDNYITIQGYATYDEDNDGDEEYEYINRSGYLVDRIIKEGDTYTYDGITFSTGVTECLTEYLGENPYPYAKLNGTKYYLDYKNGKDNPSNNDEVFYINVTGERAVQAKRGNNTTVFEKYEEFINKNNSAYRYYKEAYEFTEFVHNTFGELTANDAVNIEFIDEQENYFTDDPIFGIDNNDDTTESTDIGTPIQDLDSNFNQHRAAIIRYTIEKNLEAAITGFKEYSNAEDAEFIMPEISETDWETLQNNISIVTFLQGFNIAGREYNEYCVVANTLTKEYVDENDIYILGNDGMYYKPNDTSLTSVKSGLGYEPGIWKLNFERKNYRYAIDNSDNYQNYYYYPIRVSDPMPYLGSYSSIINSTSVDNTYQDLYKYMRNKSASNEADASDKEQSNFLLKQTYYTALARERWGQYHVTKSIDINSGNFEPGDSEDIIDGEDEEKPDTEEPDIEVPDINEPDVEEPDIEEPDTEAPLAELRAEPADWTNGDVTLTYSATDNEGIKGYLINTSENKPGESEYTIIDDSPIQIKNGTETITKEENYEGEETYYLHVIDTSGNYYRTDAVSVKIDKKAPTVTVDPDRTKVSKDKAITITLTDEGGSGLVSETGTYYLSSSRTENDKIIEGIFTSGEAFEIGKGLTGTYYLWVGDVLDKAGNKNEEHFIGEGSNAQDNKGKYIFDNTAPTINNFKITSSTENTINVETSAVDIGNAGIASYEYYILYPDSTAYISSEKNTSTSVTDKYTYSDNLSVGNTYKVGVIVTDAVGNSTKSKTIELELIDNYMITKGTSKQYKPTLADAISVAENESTITVLKSVEDNSEAIIDGIENLTINLNENTITREQPITITSQSTVTFVGKGFIKTKNKTDNSTIINGGECIVNFEANNGIAHQASSTTSSLKNRAIHNTGNLIMKSGLVEEETSSGIAILLDNDSTFTMDDGEVLYKSVGVEAKGDNISIKINNGTIKHRASYTSAGYGVYLYSSENINFTMNGGEITSNSRAIWSYVSNNVTINILGGTVSGKTYGIAVSAPNIECIPEVTVGNKDDIYNQETVMIEGGKHAMYFESDYIESFISVYFYNGVLRTTTEENEVLSGTYIQEIRLAYTIIDETEAGIRYKYLNYLENAGENDMYAIENKLYSNLQDAVTAAVDGDIIVLLKDGEESSKVNYENKDIILLLNSYTLTKTINTINIGQNATMTVTGNQATFETPNIIGFNVIGTIKMYGKVNMKTESSKDPLFDTNSDNAKIYINNGNLEAKGSNARIINLDKAATCYIRDWASLTLYDGSSGIYNTSNGGIINLEHGTITVNNSYGVYNTSNMKCTLGDIEMKIKTSAYGIYNNDTSSGSISDKQTSISRLYLNTGTSVGIYNAKGSTVSIKINNRIDMESSIYSTDSVAIYNEGSGDIQTGRSSLTAGYGIINTGSGSIAVRGNTTGGGSSATILGFKCAIYNNNSQAQITIGDKDKRVNQYSSIEITNYDTNYPAIYTHEESTFEFYNGLIQSGSQTIYNKTPILRDGYSIQNKTVQENYGPKIFYRVYLVKN